jgi:hypothetical protein
VFANLNFIWQPMAVLKPIVSSRAALAASVLTCLALGALANDSTGAAAAEGGAQIALALPAEREQAQSASRSMDRSAPNLSTEDLSGATATAPADGAAAALVAPVPAATPEPAVAAPPPVPPPVVPAIPTPAAGLTQVQMNNAKRIVDVGKAMGLPQRAYVIAIACAMQESNLHNLASAVLPESYSYTDEGSGSDHDSVGLFQQRPSSGWGSVKNLMNPDYAARQFYKALTQVSGWQGMALTYAAQAVQVSAYPEAYARHESRATTVVNALTGN